MIKKVNYKSVLLFTLPSIIAMVFTSFYTMVDGAFVANLVNQDALSAINITLPVVMIVIAAATMIGVGGNAIYAKLLGEGKTDQAREKFTLFSISTVVLSIIFTVLILIFSDSIISFLGADENVYQYAYDYLNVYVLFTPFVMLQIVMQTALITAGKPNLSLISMLIGGFSNIILDYVFIETFSMGISGAALATGIGNILGTIIGVIFFLTNKKNKILSFKWPKMDVSALIAMSSNGSSEMVANLSSAVITLLFNQATFAIAGNDGVAAITVILYAQFFSNAVYTGYSMGIAPVISFNYGNSHSKNLCAIFKISVKFLAAASIIMLAVAFLLSKPISSFFLEEGTNAHALAMSGMAIFATSFLFSGFNIYASAMFTAYSNGRVSAIISFLRTFFFIAAAILILPYLIGINGVWLAVPIAEFLVIFLSFYFIRKYKHKYMYSSKSKYE